MANLDHYQSLWDQRVVEINTQNDPELAYAVNKINTNQSRYQNVCNTVNK